MELEELKLNWKAANEQIETLRAEQAALKQTIELGRAKSTGNRLKRGPIFELVAACLTVLWTGGFLSDNWEKVLKNPGAAAPSGVLYALGIFSIWLSIRQLILISGMDYSAPVAENQARIAALRSLRVRSAQFTMLAGLPLWVIFPLVGGQAIFGFEFVQAVDSNWILGNLVFGVVVSAGIVWAARRFGSRSAFLQKVDDLLAGTEIVRAEQELEGIRRFGREE